jgi:hypothetical protein
MLLPEVDVSWLGSSECGRMTGLSIVSLDRSFLDIPSITTTEPPSHCSHGLLAT